MKRIILILLVLFLITGCELGDLGEGLPDTQRSEMYEWYFNLDESMQEEYYANAAIYADEYLKNRNYTISKNENITNSTEDEPAFDNTICLNLDLDPSGDSATFCSCGDGVCASYEDKCDCSQDCGTCSEGTICKRGSCFEIIENTCINTLCEGNEEYTCPWDCEVAIFEEREEVEEFPEEVEEEEPAPLREEVEEEVY